MREKRGLEGQFKRTYVYMDEWSRGTAKELEKVVQVLEDEGIPDGVKESIGRALGLSWSGEACTMGAELAEKLISAKAESLKAGEGYVCIGMVQRE